MNGFDVASGLRAAGISTPILMLTARDSISDKVRGFDCGIEDFLTKPFSFLELLARVRVLVRRGSAPPRIWNAHDLSMDIAARRVTRNGQTIALTPTEFSMLELLLRLAGTAVSRPELVRAGWGPNASVDDNNLDVAMSSLRAKVDKGHTQRLIHTIRGFGYRLDSSRRSPA